MFERVLAVTSSTVDIMAKSFQKPRKVHFLRIKMDISAFQQGRRPASVTARSVVYIVKHKNFVTTVKLSISPGMTQ
jgi:hypothetical protein